MKIKGILFSVFIIAATTGDNEFHGGPGDDIIYGGEGSNELFGDKGNDLLYDLYGGDSLSGGPGDDIYRIVGGKSDSDTGLTYVPDVPTNVLNPPNFTQLPIDIGSTPTDQIVLDTIIVDFE